MEKYLTCSHERWKEAQKWELNAWLGSEKNLEDWNSWWFNHFQNFNYLDTMSFRSLLEVGCGPYCRNTEYFMKLFPSIKTITVLDPLLNDYIKHEYYVCSVVKLYSAKTFSCALEDYSDNIKYDAILCINVLDHVENTNICMDRMYDALNDNGVLILGQDLTCEEDFKSDPGLLTDPGHPIRLDHYYFRDKLKNYKHIFHKILPRELGRNPKAHYGTLFYVGAKK
jgi:hypothetical protein